MSQIIIIMPNELGYMWTYFYLFYIFQDLYRYNLDIIQNCARELTRQRNHLPLVISKQPKFMQDFCILAPLCKIFVFFSCHNCTFFNLIGAMMENLKIASVDLFTKIQKKSLGSLGLVTALSMVHIRNMNIQ